MKNHKKLSIIVKPTHSCNLACRYCYIEPRAEQGMMDTITLENMINKSLVIHDAVDFIWHGGEPLLMPLGFYEKAVELQNKYPQKKVTNGFQSNGTLVNNKILDFCQANHFNIGFSLDGYLEINNQTRNFRNGKSSFHRTLEAIKKAQERKLGGGAIVVINKLNIDSLTEIYEFAKKESINLKLNPLIKSGKATNHYRDLGIGPQEYGRALVKLFDQWFIDNSEIKVDPFEDLIGNILTNRPWGCHYSVSCQYSFISMGPQGDIYPCGRFDGVPGFRLGNINKDDLNEVLNSGKRKEMQQRSSKITSCKSCDYIKICNSGCMHNAFMHQGNLFDKDYYCASYKLLFAHISKAVEKELKNAEVA